MFLLLANCQRQILTHRILATKFPNSDVNFAVDFVWMFPFLEFPTKSGPQKPPKIPRNIRPEMCLENSPWMSAEALA